MTIYSAKINGQTIPLDVEMREDKGGENVPVLGFEAASYLIDAWNSGALLHRAYSYLSSDDDDQRPADILAHWVAADGTLAQSYISAFYDGYDTDHAYALSAFNNLVGVKIIGEEV